MSWIVHWISAFQCRRCKMEKKKSLVGIEMFKKILCVLSLLLLHFTPAEGPVSQQERYCPLCSSFLGCGLLCLTLLFRVWVFFKNSEEEKIHPSDILCSSRLSLVSPCRACSSLLLPEQSCVNKLFFFIFQSSETAIGVKCCGSGELASRYISSILLPLCVRFGGRRKERIPDPDGLVNTSTQCPVS